MIHKRLIIGLSFVFLLTLSISSCVNPQGRAPDENSAEQIPPGPTPSPFPTQPPEKPYPPNAKDATALSITKRLKAYHLPHGLLASAMYKAEDSKILYRWDAFADSALWTGTYLAAEAFRYKVTKTQDALVSAARVVESIRLLSLLNGDGLLARHYFPTNAPDVDAYLQDNADITNVLTTVFAGQEYYYLTRTSRDQYAGIFFGLGVAYDMLDDKVLKNTIRDIVTRLVDYLLKNNWCTINPDGSIRTTFVQMPAQQLSILQLARHVNPEKFTSDYEKLRNSAAKNAWFAIWVEGQDQQSTYYKFNLSHLYLYNLLRLEESNSTFQSQYKKAYDTLVDTVKDHMNAHFNMVDRSVRGPEKVRDGQTIEMLDQLSERGFKSHSIDVRGKYAECGENRACQAIPVSDRIETGFMWQTPPWDLYYDGDSRIEGSGVDYLLPYWMSRYYEVQ